MAYLNITQPVNISNEKLWERTKQMPTEQQIKERKWHRIDHTLRKTQGAAERHALDCNPQVTRKRSRERKPGKEEENGNCRRKEKARKTHNNLLCTEPNGRPSRRPYVPQRNKRSE